MIPLITKQQIGKFVTLSENVANLEVDSFIKDACEFDTINVFPIALLEAIEVNIKAKIQQWNKNKTYSVGNIVIYDSFYTCLTSNTDSQPPSANWEDNELMNFYNDYLQPFIAYSFYYRFISYHGAQITQAGVTQLTDPTYEQISDKRRAEMLGDIRNKINVWTGKVSKKLNDVSFTFDDVVYTPETGKSTRIRSGVKIWALGGVEKKCCYPFNSDIQDA